MHKFTIFIFLIIILKLLSPDCNAQDFDKCIYNKSIKIDSVNSSYTKLIDSISEIDKNKLLNYNKSVSTEMTQWLKYRQEYASDILKYKFLYTNEPINQYLQNILNTILIKNNIDSNSIRIYLTRFVVPNAFNMGLNTIYINIGLIQHIENESQLAFVIAHELSHQILYHVYNEQLKNVIRIKSDEIQQRIREANNQKYENKSKLKSIQNDLVFNFSKHSRNHESQSDSLAIALLLNTNYSISESKRMLINLDKIEEQRKNTFKIRYVNYFKDYYPQPRANWDVLNLDSTFANISKDIDSVYLEKSKTHPDCNKRIAYIDSTFSTRISQYDTAINIEFQKFKYNSMIEYLESLHFTQNYGLGFHETMRYLFMYPDDQILKLKLLKFIASISYSQKNRTLGEVLDLPNLNYDEAYNYSLSFLNELKIIESSTISYMLLTDLPKDEQCEEYLYVAILVYHIYNEPELKNYYKSIYKSRFKEGKYIYSINNLK